MLSRNIKISEVRIGQVYRSVYNMIIYHNFF